MNVTTALLNILFICLPPAALLVCIWALGGFSYALSIIFGLALEAVALAFSIGWTLTTWNVSDPNAYGSGITAAVMAWIVGTVAIMIVGPAIPTLTTRRGYRRITVSDED